MAFDQRKDCWQDNQLAYLAELAAETQGILHIRARAGAGDPPLWDAVLGGSGPVQRLRIALFASEPQAVADVTGALLPVGTDVHPLAILPVLPRGWDIALRDAGLSWCALDGAHRLAIPGRPVAEAAPAVHPGPERKSPTIFRNVSRQILLASLQLQDRWFTAQELLDLVDVSYGMISRCLSGMRSRGWVQRQRNNPKYHYRLISARLILHDMLMHDRDFGHDSNDVAFILAGAEQAPSASGSAG